MGTQEGRRVLTISSPQDATLAATSAVWLGRPRVDSVEIAVPGVTRARASALGKRIHGLFNDRGYAWGAVALGSVLAVIVLVPRLVGWPAGLGWGTSLAACTAAAMGGTMLGLAWSWWRLRWLLRRLAAMPGVVIRPLDPPRRAADRPSWRRAA